ncbi:sugar ABC transporter substrate-binding protein [Streptomyces sp. ITFR-16]|uniref:ABC transporter substrate-binding protein n=1 Tax=Streptomyces sp. ITFR-16 TaxID=3075198 RepID=UPI00288B245F|nr:sugar ABC transporter substrate-binding protein [Streptomyces sp. ITFR-16]WNI21041.1 sugar ABC transporter substrate-binding protein [Streptomyces sp. ITFR-16]
MKTPAHSRTKAALAGLAAFGLLSLTACGGSNGDSGPVSLRMTVWTGNEAHLKILNEIATDYRKAHPDIESIKFDTLPLESYTTTLTTQVAGGKSPDLAWIMEDSAPDFVSSGALAEIKDDKEVLPSAKKLWQQDGKTYAYPFSTSPFGVFVNKDLLKRAGQPEPAELIKQGKWNWDQVSATGAAVHEKTGKTGMVIRDFEFKQWKYLASVWNGWGAEAWSADGKSCGFTSPEMTAAMTYLHDSIFKDESMLAPGTSADFFAGESAMTVAQISRASLLTDKFAWDFVPLPEGPKGSYDVIGQAGLAAFARGKHVSAATNFLAFMTNEENAAKLGKFFPQARNFQLDAATLAKSNPQVSQEQLENVVVKGVKQGKTLPSHTGADEISDTVRSALDPLWKPGADVKKVLADVCEAIEPQLRK